MSTKALAIFWASYALSLHLKTSSLRRSDVENACSGWSRQTYWRAYDELQSLGFIHYSKWFVYITPQGYSEVSKFLGGQAT